MRTRRYHLCQERKAKRKADRERIAFNAQFVSIYVYGSRMIVHKKDVQKLIYSMPAEALSAGVEAFNRSMQFAREKLNEVKV